ncbi:MAG: hypothetical protein BWK79_00340 [Beggiatoa sp. IS2]|nr:MAG: hypothetical protein BWK79_00340 [Beggiatoa sp. IS2]
MLKLDISELMNIKVTSVAKKPQKLSQSAAAVFVINHDDIRRSGATTIADVLRMVPGLQVAKYNSHSWAISARGFNSYYANKLLVLIDGRSVYTPEFSGVYWDSVDTFLDDIERIEVIRGPGGTLWGANAVNGVINIITKSAKDTRGGLITTSIGDEERGSMQFRYGDALDADKKSFYRVYAKTIRHDDLPIGFYGTYKDSWYRNQAGFRVDGQTQNDDQWTVQGDIYHSGLDEANYQNSAQVGRIPVQGWNVLGRWQRQLSAESDISAQWYYDYYKRSPLKQGFSNKTFDFELQHRFHLSQRQEILWGGGYRFQDNYMEDKPGVVRYESDTRQSNLFNLFVQNEIQLVPDEWTLTVGTKFEHNAFTGLEIQPNLRLLWTPLDTHYSVWTAISRAVRTPARNEHDEKAEFLVAFPPPMNPFYPEPMEFRFLSNPEIKSETLLAYELGIRSQVTPRLSWDLATFYHKYDDLMVFDHDMFVENRIIFEDRRVNGMYGHSYGAELAVDWQPLDDWRLTAAYTFFDMQLQMAPGVEADWKRIEDKSPHNQLSLRSHLTLPHNWQFETWLRYVGKIDVPLGLYRDGGSVKAYTTLDARLAWQISKQLEVSIIGQNLLDKQFLESPVDPYNPLLNQVQRGVYGQLRWQF